MRSIGSVIALPPTGQPEATSAPDGTPAFSSGSLATRPAKTIQRESVPETEAAVRASLPASVRSSLRTEMSTVIGDDGQFEGSFVSKMEIGDVPHADLIATRAILDDACRPAPLDVLTMALTKMALVTKTRKEDGPDTTARIATLTELLRDWPGDVALAAIKRHRDGGRFFPAWADLLTSCRVIGGKRVALRRAVSLKLVEADHAP